MTYQPESKYPSRRSYVLKLTNEASATGLVGRLENLVTGSRREFFTGRELLEFIAGDLETICDDSSRATPDGTGP
ncbi:MAG TPA: hypothetical protein VMG60_15070 [Burkholderiaceae bacterium]|nr:hypothetical protein [Burkholderiaceae bacterium]